MSVRKIPILAILAFALVTSVSMAAEKTFDKHFDALPGGRIINGGGEPIYRHTSGGGIYIEALK